MADETWSSGTALHNAYVGPTDRTLESAELRARLRRMERIAKKYEERFKLQEESAARGRMAAMNGGFPSTAAEIEAKRLVWREAATALSDILSA